MKEKKIVKKNESRKSQQEKIKEALSKKPTASYLNRIGMSISQSNQLAGNISEDKEKLLKERLVKNAKNRKRFSNRPLSVIVQDVFIDDTQSLTTQSPSNETISSSNEFPTPDWFTNKEPVDVSVIIPLYKSDKVIKDLIENWPLENQLKVEIIFIDDQCPNDSKNVVLNAWKLREKEISYPIGKILVNKNNIGYGQTCNAGVKVALGKFLIFLNADTVVTPGWVEPMIELLNDDKVGLVGNLHLKEGGLHDQTIDSAGSEWRWTEKTFSHIGRHSYKKKNIANPFHPKNAPKDLLEVSEREMVTGCCFAMKKELFDYIGGFNPNYRIGYWEDSEICLNVRELGYKIMFQPNSVIYHKLGHTNSGGHRYFLSNRQYFMNKWVKSHRIDNLLLSENRKNDVDQVNRILIRRSNAHGDALVATGVCAALKKKYPKARIMFCTLFPEIICQNQYIDEFIELKRINQVKFDVYYNLDYCYEWRPNVDIMTAYAEAVGVKVEDCKLHMVPQELKTYIPKKYIVIHAGKTDWVGRDWPHDNFIKISDMLMDNGYNVVSVGKYTEKEIPCTVDLRGKTSLSELAWVMSKATAFIGIDSLPMHVAQAFDVPGVSFFGCIKPSSRIYSKKMHGITANNLACLGCHHRKPAPSTVTKICETKDLACISGVSVNQMWSKINKVLKEINASNIVLG